MAVFPPVVAGAAFLALPTQLLTGADSLVLDYGPHTVGFTVIEALDSTRAFRPLRDFEGRLTGETARPIQISVWYPAHSTSGTHNMRGGDFQLLRHTEVEFATTLSAADSARLRMNYIETAAGAGMAPTAAAKLWDEPTPAVRNRRPLPGAHPTVLYFGAVGLSDPLLPAYLASHGFVVASFPSNGRMTEGTLEYTPNALTLDTDLGDAGFVHAVLRRLPYADTRRLAVTSFSGNSLAALLWTMRDMQASAIVTIEGWERYRRGTDIITRSVHYEPHRVRVPYLMIERAPDEVSPQFAKVDDVVGALPYAEITRAAYRDAAHADFLSHASFGHSPHHRAIYASAARMVRQYLQATLQGDTASGRALASLAPPANDPFFAITRSAAIGPVPTEEELFRLAESSPHAAAAAYRAATREVVGAQLFREAVLTRAAFSATPDARVSIMEVVVDAYPTSTAARFRLGQALMESGRADEAAAAFRIARELVEADPSLDAAARSTWRERLDSALRSRDAGALHDAERASAEYDGMSGNRTGAAIPN